MCLNLNSIFRSCVLKVSTTWRQKIPTPKRWCLNKDAVVCHCCISKYSFFVCLPVPGSTLIWALRIFWDCWKKIGSTIDHLQPSTHPNACHNLWRQNCFNGGKNVGIWSCNYVFLSHNYEILQTNRARIRGLQNLPKIHPVFKISSFSNQSRDTCQNIQYCIEKINS